MSAFTTLFEKPIKLQLDWNPKLPHEKMENKLLNTAQTQRVQWMEKKENKLLNTDQTILYCANMTSESIWFDRAQILVQTIQKYIIKLPQRINWQRQ